MLVLHHIYRKCKLKKISIKSDLAYNVRLYHYFLIINDIVSFLSWGNFHSKSQPASNHRSTFPFLIKKKMIERCSILRWTEFTPFMHIISCFICQYVSICIIRLVGFPSLTPWFDGTATLMGSSFTQSVNVSYNSCKSEHNSWPCTCIPMTI